MVQLSLVTEDMSECSKCGVKRKDVIRFVCGNTDIIRANKCRLCPDALREYEEGEEMARVGKGEAGDDNMG